MANILLTQKCVRSCPYCFAKQHMSENEPDDTLTWENLMYIVDFFDASNEKHFSLLGGEPFLHPQFIDIVLYLRERKFRTNVFTSGIMSNKMFEDAIKEFRKEASKNREFEFCSIIFRISILIFFSSYEKIGQ